MYNSEKYSECNPDPCGYCIFEKQAKEAQEKLEKIKEIHLKYYRAEINIGDFHIQLTAILKEIEN